MSLMTIFRVFLGFQLLSAWSGIQLDAAVSSAIPATTITWSSEKQEIDGFGASTAWTYWGMTDIQADDFFSPTKGIGLSLVRMRVAPGATTMEGEIISAQKAIARGAKVWATPWSPKASYKSNNDVNHGGKLNVLNYGNYSDDLVNYVKNLKAQKGINLYALSLQNEPDWTTDYESCNFSGQQLHDFLAVIGPKFTNAGLGTKLMLPESASGNNNLGDASIDDPITRPYVGLIGQHMYWYDGYVDYPKARNFGIKTWETEVCPMGPNQGGWDATMQTGLLTADWLQKSLVECNNSAFHYWWFWNVNGQDNNGGLVSGMDQTKKSKAFWVMGNYSRFIRPGWKRINASPMGAFYVSAYKDPATGAFAVVVTNKAAVATPLTVQFAGVSTDKVIPWVTDAVDNLAAKTAVMLTGGIFTYTMTATSVTTFVGNGLIPPSINTQPTSVTVDAGQAATFRVLASGTPPLVYQWKLGTANVGSNSDSLTVSNAQVANAGSYTCVVSNSVGSVTSSGAIMTITSSVANPTITSPLVANGILGAAFTYQISGSNTPTSFSATGLPIGLSIVPATGLISGVPATAGSNNVIISATNAGGTGAATLEVNIADSVAPVRSSSDNGGSQCGFGNGIAGLILLFAFGLARVRRLR